MARPIRPVFISCQLTQPPYWNLLSQCLHKLPATPLLAEAGDDIDGHAAQLGHRWLRHLENAS